MGDNDRQFGKIDCHLAQARSLVGCAAHRTQINNQHHVMDLKAFPKPFDSMVIQFAAEMDATESSCLGKLELYTHDLGNGYKSPQTMIATAAARGPNRQNP